MSPNSNHHDAQSDAAYPKPHILLVEDDPAIATSLKVTFKREGWQVTWLDNATDVLPTLKTFYQDNQTISGIILDVGLPDGDGLSLCQTIRHSDDIGTIKQLPIVFLTARSDEVDRILGLEMGGDDYCPKPFSPRELVARLKAIWRREQLTAALPNEQTDADASVKEFNLTSGTWRYDPLTYTLYWNDIKLELSNTERKLLLALLEKPDRILSREQLLCAISEYPDHRLARTIDSHVKSIRKQLVIAHQKTQNATKNDRLSQKQSHSITENGNMANSDIADNNRENSDIEIIYTHRGIGYGLYPA